MYRVVLSVLVVCLALSACGGQATPDPAEVARAVAATLTAQAPTATPVPTNTPVPTPTPAVQTYRNETQGIAFNYPVDWELKGENNILIEIQKTGGKENAAIATFSLVRLDKRPLLQAEAFLLSISLTALEIIEPLGERSVGGSDGVAMVVREEKAPRFEGESIWRLGVVVHPETGYTHMFSAAASAEYWNETQSVHQAILDSVEFFVPTTPTVPSTPELYELIPPRGGLPIYGDGRLERQVVGYQKEYHHPYEITEEFDRFTSTTNVLLKPDFDEADGEPGSLFVLYSYEGEGPTPPATVEFSFYSSHDGWKYLKCHSLYFLLDGEKQMAVDTDHRGNVGKGYVTEFVSATFTLKDFLAIVNSTKVEGRLCNDEFKFSLNQMSALRDFASRMLPE